MPPTFWVLLALGLQQAAVTSAQGGCDAYLYRSHNWTRGYVGKLYLDQNNLPGSTLQWNLTITFDNEVQEFKVWDADIKGTTKNYVNNVAEVVVENKCYNPILYPCQFLELPFLVRFPEPCGDPCDAFDIKKVVESGLLSDDQQFTINFDTICPGQPTSAPTATTVAG